MSLLTRRLADVCRHRMGWFVPQDVFAQSSFWDDAYRRLDGAVYEWGSTSFHSLDVHTYCNIALDKRGAWTDHQSRDMLEGRLEEVVPRDVARPVVVLGAGHSHLGPQMHAAGWPRVINCDFSSIAMDTMRRRHRESKGASGDDGLLWETLDARERGTLARVVGGRGLGGCIVDKGLLDSLYLCGAQADAAAVMRNARDGVGVGNNLVLLTLSAPSFILPWLASSAPSGEPVGSLSPLQEDGKVGRRGIHGWNVRECRGLSNIYLVVLEAAA